jgi:hypothetical protein
MQKGILLSTVFHVVILAVLLFGLPSSQEPPVDHLVPIEIVTPEDLAEPPEPEAVEEAPEPQPEPEPEVVEEKPVPIPPTQEARLPPEPQPQPPETEPPPPEPQPETEPAPLPTPEAEAEKTDKPLPPPAPRRKPQIKMAAPKEEQPDPETDALTSILRNVEKLRSQPKAKQRAPANSRQTADATPRRQVSVFERNEMIRALQKQLYGCWRLDPGARDAKDLVVEIAVVLNPDGSVRSTHVVDTARIHGDAYFRSAAENAERAIRICSPFRLPAAKYEVWREITLRFNPREMFGT